MKKFQVSQTYSTRSIGDYNCIFSFEILKRTAKSVWVEVDGEVVRRAIIVWRDAETFKPFGTYSMCPIVTAK